MPSWGSLSYAFGPVVAAGMLLGLVLLLRWAFGGGQSLVRPVEVRAGEPGDYGVLQPVAAPRDENEADAVRAALAEHAVDCTLAHTTRGLRVLVWPEDAERARGIVRRLSA